MAVYGRTHTRLFTVQLKLENQDKVLPIGRLKGVTIDLDGVRTMTDLK
jgi:hypothetical protein